MSPREKFVDYDLKPVCKKCFGKFLSLVRSSWVKLLFQIDSHMSWRSVWKSRPITLQRTRKSRRKTNESTTCLPAESDSSKVPTLLHCFPRSKTHKLQKCAWRITQEMHVKKWRFFSCETGLPLKKQHNSEYTPANPFLYLFLMKSKNVWKVQFICNITWCMEIILQCQVL